MRYVVVGGGIAGVSCTKRLLHTILPKDQLTLVSASECVKSVVNWTKVGQFTELFDVEESNVFANEDRVHLRLGRIVKWKPTEKVLVLDDGSTLMYDKLCIATGAAPIQPFKDSRIITLRDTDSARRLQEKTSGAKRVAVVGNGGIATEIVYELKNASITWLIRDKHISSPFFLPCVSKFLEDRMNQGRVKGGKNDGVVKHERFVAASEPSTSRGCALGPDWSTATDLSGSAKGHSVHLLPSSEVVGVSGDSDLILRLRDGSSVVCDMAVWAIGARPDTSVWTENYPELSVSASDGGLLVDQQMATSVPDVFACGDVCSVEWPNQSDSWKQMRLWTQARQMGDFCGRSMSSVEPVELDFCFELFAHVTTFYGYKVVLLGDFKAEKQPDGWYICERVVSETEYVCCIMYEHRVVGAILVGDTNLEEMLENLILNRTDLERIEHNFLDPRIDIEDYFD